MDRNKLIHGNFSKHKNLKYVNAIEQIRISD